MGQFLGDVNVLTLPPFVIVGPVDVNIVSPLPLPISAVQLPAALVGGRLDTAVGAWFGSTAPTVGQKVMADSLPVTIASNQTALPITAAALPLPAGAATEATLLTRAQAAQLPAALVGGRLDTNVGAWLGSTAPTVGQKAAAASLPVVLASDSTLPLTPVTTATGALGALNAAVTIVLAGQTSVGFQLAAGTLIGTIVPEISLDGGATYNTAYFDDVNSALTQSIVFTVANTAQTRTIVCMGGATHARVRVTVFTSGTATLTFNASQITDPTRISVPSDGFKKTYFATVIGLAVALLPTDVFTITGAAGVVVRVTRVLVTGTRNANGHSDFVFLRRSTANTLGISSTPTAVFCDSQSGAASAVVRAYTANPTLGTLVGNMVATRLFLTGVSGTPPQQLELEFGKRFSTSVILRSAAEVFALNLNGVTVTTGLLNVTIEWTEEPG